MLIASSFEFRIPSSFRHWSFVIFDGAFIQRAENPLFFHVDFSSDKDQFGATCLERLQVPAAGDEIEKLRAIREANKAFCPNHARGQAVGEAFEAIARKCFIGTKRERLELELMLVLQTRDFLFAADAEQQFRIDLAALGANNGRCRIDFAQLRFQRLDLRSFDEVNLIQKQNVRAFDLQSGGMTEFWETNEHICVDHRHNAVEPALWYCFLNVEHQRFGFGEAGGLDYYRLRLDFLDDLVDRCFKFAEQRATN